MNKSFKKIMLITSAIVLIGFCYVVYGVLAFKFLVGDVKGVTVQGVVYDAVIDKPLENVKVVIFSERYRSDNGYSNNDEYLGCDTIAVTTDDRGNYLGTINYSTHLQVRVYKQGYELSESDWKKAKKKIKLDFFLEKGESKELDLYRGIDEASEIIELNKD